MPTFCQKDARMRGYVFVYRAMFMDTYSAIQVASELVNGRNSFSGLLAIEPR